MKPGDIEKLLGAYATGTLTEQERAALYEAALSDQALYDALMREQPLRELLEDPVSRARLTAVLSDAPSPKRSWWLRPVPWATAGALMAVGLAAFLALDPHSRRDAPMVRAKLEQAPAANIPSETKDKVLGLAKVDEPLLVRREALVGKEIPRKIAQPAPAPHANMASVQVAADAKSEERAELKRAELVAAAVVQPVALDYRVWKQSGSEFVETPAGAVLSSGDVVRLAVVTPADGQLALQSEHGLAPMALVTARRGTPVTIPAEGGIKLGPGAGSKTVRLLFIASPGATGEAATMRLRQAPMKKISDEMKPPEPVRMNVVLHFR